MTDLVMEIKKLTFFVKNLLTANQPRAIVHLTINIKNLFFIARFLARVVKSTVNT